MQRHPGLVLIHRVGDEDFNAEERCPVLHEEHVRTQAAGCLSFQRDLIEIKVSQVEPGPFRAGTAELSGSVSSSTPASCQDFGQPGFAAREKF
jgi:hypothetical protein